MVELSGYAFSVLREGEPTLSRGCRDGFDSILVVSPLGELPTIESIKRLEREYALRADLDSAWAARPSALTTYRGKPVLVLEDPGGETLLGLLAGGLHVAIFLQIAIDLTATVRQMHRRGLIHKDIKPTNILVDTARSSVRLTGFSIASRVAREHQAPEPPDVIAGTLAYMAPEQTGRMNRSIDSRSDLYALGVTFYQMLTGVLPFAASDPIEWVHCHIARRAVPPCDRAPEVPEQLSMLVMKLLAKTPEDRYQSAAGAEADLRRCLAEWEAAGNITSFALGRHDVPDRLMIPEKLYGRERDVERLLAAFDRVVADGSPRLVLVSGYSGIGKSSVVNELHKALVSPRALFASGKFDQYKRDIPYATLAQAFEGLMRMILSRPDPELAQWREAIRDAIGPNGQLLLNLIPELELIVGKQPPIPELSPHDTLIRFQMVFRRFLGVFARPEHPFVLFIDDLQWLDAATLQLLEYLLVESDTRHLLLVGAYRSNEVGAEHPLTRTLNVIRQAGAPVQEIVLTALGLEDVNALVADSLRVERPTARALAQLVQEKTGGNPFFTIQFFAMLAEEGLLAFDSVAATWSWDVARIRAKGYTDNVVVLMAGKLNRLAARTQDVLRQFACLGHTAELATLAMVCEEPQQTVEATLAEAVEAGLVLWLGNTCNFLHDRVQEAAYALIPDESRAEAHLRIGRSLAAHTSPEMLPEVVFDIVNQINRGAALVTLQAERDQFAELNLIAGNRAKASTAYASALTYLTAGCALLTATAWKQQYRLIFDLEFNRSECEILTGALATAEERLAALSRRVENIADKAAVACLRADLYTNLGQAERAVEVGFECLRLVGLSWSMHPTDEEVDEEYARIWRQLGKRSVEDLLELPSMTDANSRAAVDVLTSLQAPAHFIDRNLVCLIIGRMAILSFEHGNTDGSCFAYVYLGMILESRFGDYRRGLRFGQLGINLLEKNGLDRFRARVYNNFAMAINPWANHVRTSIDLLRGANQAARGVGDVTFMGYSHVNLISALLIAGDRLGDVQTEAETALNLLQRARFGIAVDMVLGQLGLIRALRGLTGDISTFNHAKFDEHQFERHLEEDPGLVMPACWYWIRKMQACYLAGSLSCAVAAAARAEALLWTSPGFIVTADYHFYAVLVRLAQYGGASADERDGIANMIEGHRKMLAVWAEHCPDTFANRAALVAAEISRIEGRGLDAMHFYEDAIRSANANGFVQNEALANELAARFHEARGFGTIADVYRRSAMSCYRRWGADGKARQLEQKRPGLGQDAASLPSEGTIGTPVEHLELTTVVKVAQAISGEMELEKLIDALMVLALQHAGGERGLLILARGDELWTEAEAVTIRDTVKIDFRQAPVALAELPHSVLRYVVRSRESLLLGDASGQNQFSGDEYILRNQCRSILCVPFIKQAQLVGILYIENNQTPHAFTPDRFAVLKLLASQAAISIENARLYADLVRENAERRKAEEALRASEASLAEGQRISHTGSWRWNVRTGEVQWSAEYCRIFGFDPAVEHPSYTKCMRRIHPEDRSQVHQIHSDAIRGNSIFRHEYRIIMPDGSIKSLQSTGHPDTDENGEIEFVGAVMDITETRRSQEALLDAQAALAHASRVATLGEISATIAHEVNQPLAAIITNSESGLRWLNRTEPNVEKVWELTKRVVADARRASEIIGRIRAMATRRAPDPALLSLDDIVAETMVFLRHELQSKSVAASLDLAPALPQVLGDRTQLQQVVVNLAINAIQAMAQSGAVRRSVFVRTLLSDPETVCCSIEDSGPGIDPTHLPRLFDSFFTTKESGMGMGLPICRSIIEAHGGSIRADNDSSLGGARFSFILPAHVASVG